MKGPALSRPARAFVVALAVALVSGVALAAWSASASAEMNPAPLLPQGPMLDRLLDDAQASPTQRATAHQIFDAAQAQITRDHAAERADRQEMARLFAQPAVDAAAVESVRLRIEARHDAQSRLATRALIDIGLVLNVGQRQTIATRLANAPTFFAQLPHPHPALAAND